jgi:hypothetical protein
LSQNPTAAPKGAITLLLTHDQTATLDEIAAAIRRNTGQCVSRSAMIRAIATALLPYYADWLQCRSEAQIQQMITRRLQADNK